MALLRSYNILEMGIFTMPSNIYDIVTNYIGGAAKKQIGNPSSSAGNLIYFIPITKGQIYSIMEQFTRKTQELCYKTMVLGKILLHKNDSPNCNYETQILINTEQKIENCVRTKVNIAVSSKIIKHTIKSNKAKEQIVRKHKITDNNNYKTRVNQKSEMGSIPQQLAPKIQCKINTTKIDHTHTPTKNPLNKKESSLQLTPTYNLLYHGLEKKGHGEKALYISVKEHKNSRIKKHHNYKLTPNNFKARHSSQQSKQIWDPQKERGSQIRYQKVEANLYTASRFYEICRQNNLKIVFKEYSSYKPIISLLNNKESRSKYRRIQNINQRFAIKKLLNIIHKKEKYYLIEIEVKYRHQHLVVLRQSKYKDLQFFTILIENYQEPNYTNLCTRFLNITNDIIMATGKPDNNITQDTRLDNYHQQKLQKTKTKMNSTDNNSLYYAKTPFLRVIRNVKGVDPEQIIFSYKEITSYLTKYIFINKDKFIDKHNSNIANVKDDPLGLAFKVDYFHRKQMKALLQTQLIPINGYNDNKATQITTKTREDQPLEQYKNPKRFKGHNDNIIERKTIHSPHDDLKNEDTTQKITSLDRRIQSLMMESQALRTICTKEQQE